MSESVQNITNVHPNILTVPPPEEFSFKAEHWEQYFTRFTRYAAVTELDKREAGYQISTLLYIMGPKSEELIKSLNLSDDDMKSYKAVTDKITKFYLPRHNVVFCRANFNRRMQKQGEPVESFISELHALADKCNYGELKEELIRDKIVIGILDKKLSEKLQLNEELTLQKAIDTVVQKDLIHKQQVVLNNDTSATEVNYFSDKKNFYRGNKFKKSNSNPGQKVSGEQEVFKSACPRCGNKVHFIKGKCPADGVTCRRCGGLNHFPVKPHFSRCRQTTNLVMTKTEDGDGSAPQEDDTTHVGFLNSVFQVGNIASTRSAPWMVEVEVNGVHILFTADSGACITAIPFTNEFSGLGRVIKRTDSVNGPDGSALHVVGYIDAKLY